MEVKKTGVPKLSRFFLLQSMLYMRLKYSNIIAILLFFEFMFTPLPLIAKTKTFKEYLESASDHLKAYQHFLAVDELKEATEAGEGKHPAVHMRLGVLYYGLGLLPEAVTEGEKAVALAPGIKWYRYDLAKFYFVDKQYDKAEAQFNALLKIDPGFTLGYYYLAELFFQTKQYDIAWISLSRARSLGHRGNLLTDKLSKLSSKPHESFDTLPGNDKLFRFIKVSTNSEANAIQNKILGGKLFENLELELNNSGNGSADFGVIMFSELKDSIGLFLENMGPYAKPMVISTGSDFRVIQRIIPFNLQVWKDTFGKAYKSSKIRVQKHIVVNTKPVSDQSLTP